MFIETKPQDPVFYHSGGPISDTIITCTEPAGWYYWTETWCDYHGPFETNKSANEDLIKYCDWLNTGKLK